MQNLQIYLINPRGFCAGVKRAVEIVERALAKFGTPLYIRGEIVHNKIVVNYFKNKGVIFVKTVNEIPSGANAIFSAHGVSIEVENQALQKQLNYIDATCPLVTKVHKLGIDFYNNNYKIILIGHKGHPEMEGTFGRIPNNCYIVSDIEEAKTIDIGAFEKLAYITQTTLSLDDTADIVDVLKSRFPTLEGLSSKNICYATQNRQSAIKEIINNVDALLVVGSKNSSNSNRLKELGDKHNKLSFLVDTFDDIDLSKLKNINSLAISAGASAPESAVEDIIDFLGKNFNTSLENFTYKEESVEFALPKVLR
jgi:4-hydroxy-3-methylbut-2-enyl diphosphate reductase